MWFEIWNSDNDGKWYWHLRDVFEIIADGGGHSNEQKCRRDVARAIEANAFLEIKSKRIIYLTKE